MALVESGMFTGAVPPWVGLGHAVKDAVTSKDALSLSGLDWRVEAKEIRIDGGDIIEGQKANVRSSDNKVLGIVTDRYKVVQNEDAFSFTDMLLGNGVRYETAGSLSNGKRVWLLAKMDTTKICGDDVEPYMVFTNSHDGTGAIKVAMTPIRVVCQNSLTAALNGAKRTWSARHCGDINSKLEEARHTLDLAGKYMEELEEQSDIMTQIVIPNPLFVEYLNKMFPIANNATDRQKRNIEYQKAYLRNLYEEKDDIKKFKGTGWGMLNAVADYITHYQPLRTTATYTENNFMNIVDGDKLMENTCKFLANVA